MASVIRVNTINSRSGLSTVTFDNSGAGVEVAGIVTATSFVSSGAVSGTTGTFSGDLSVAENIVHTGDTDTKIVFTNNQIDFHANSSSRLYVNQYAAYLQTGYPLAFLASSGATPNIKSGGTNNQDLLFTTGSGNPTRLQIKSDGNVGIGTDNPTIKLTTSVTHANGAVADGLRLTTTGTYSSGNSSNAGPAISFGQFHGSYPTWKTAQIAGIRKGNNWHGGLIFYTNDGGSETDISEKLRIESDGKVGMGTQSTSPGGTCNPDGNQLLIRGASTFQTNKGHIMLTGDGATNGEGPQIVFSESGSGANWAGAYIGHVRTGGGSVGDLVFGTRQTTGDANTVPTERLRITSDGGIELKTDGKGIEFPTPQTPTNSNPNRVGISSEMRYYETGTFTPGLSSTVLNSLQNQAFTDASYARRVGRYVRIGSLVHVTIEIQMASSVTYNSGSTSTAPVCIVGATPFYYAYAQRYDVSGQPDYYPCSISYNSSGLTNDTLYATLRRDFAGEARIEISKPDTGGSRQYDSTNFGEVFPANAHIIVSCTYCIDTSNADY